VYAICVLARRVSLRPIPQWAALEGCTAVALMTEYDDARQARPMTTIDQTVYTGVRNLRACTRISLRPIPQWTALEGYTTVALMTEYDDARQGNRQCVRACGALTRVRRAYLWRAQ